MRRQLKVWLQRVMQWLLRQLHWLASKPNQIFQLIHGSGNQVIAQLVNGTAINRVDNLIQHFHLSPQDILFLEDFWQNWSRDTRPPFSPNLVIGGRQEMHDRILNWLRGNPSSFTLQGDSTEEAIAFLAAVVGSLEIEERTKVLSRAVVVNSSTSWQRLITSPEPLILIARLQQPDGIGRANQQGHHVFVPSRRVSSDKTNLLPRIMWDAAEQALNEMGLNRDKARRLATLARRSLSALRRKQAVAKNIQQPAWAKPQEARVLLAPLLVGAWNDDCEGDREVLAQLSGLSYEILQAHLVRWANEPDPPLRRIGNIWMIAAQEDAWRLIARYLTDDDLKCFQNIAIHVLSERDPAFELPPEQRYAAAIHRKVLNRSNYLREGISDTLALMATLSSEISFTANQTGENIARWIIGHLLQSAKDDWTLWASLTYHLSVLSEAAPGTVLDAIEAGLSGENPILVNLFQDQASGSGMMVSSPHTGLLWALETLAWKPDYLSRAALNLARLARLDPGGRLANRPGKSLGDIFVCWHPCTTATWSSRLDVIDLIRQREPNVAWSLMRSLLPKVHSAVRPTHGTKWRDWVPEPYPSISIQEYLQITDAILERLIVDAEGNVSRWRSLIHAVTGMKSHQQDRLLDSLDSLNPQQFTTEAQVQLADGLRQEIVKHEDHADAKWAMSCKQVQRFNVILSKLEQDDPLVCHRRLFKYGVELPRKDYTSWEERDRIIETLRTEALQEILHTYGWNGVMQFAQQVKKPGLLGVTLARANLLPIDLSLFLQENFWSHESWRCEFAKSYVQFYAYNQGEPWIEACLKTDLPNWSAEAYGEFLLCLPFNTHLLDRLDASAKETQSHFWKSVSHVSFRDGQAHRVLASLLEFGRPYLALDTMAQELEQNPELFLPEQIAEVLEISIQTSPEQDFDAGSFAYDSAKLMDYLEKADLSHDRLANLELLYFHVHEDDRYPRFLFKQLAQNPEFFVEALHCIYRSENQSVAELALDILEGWKQVPGLLDDGSVDAEALRSWVIRVRELTAECDLSDMADGHIGCSLAFSPDDPDGAWPHRAVRDLIEDLANSTVEDGWCTQIYNNRGVTTRLFTDGGEQERTLVKQYEDYARQIRDQWPRTAAVLREVADSYRQEAKGHDIRAELTQDFRR